MGADVARRGGTNATSQAQRRSRTRRWLWAGAATALAVAALIWTMWPTENARTPRERQYLQFTACLLTDQEGITSPDAAQVWAGMQDASLATHAKIEYLAVAGPQTAANAVPYLNSLAQSQCNLILAAGDAPVAAVTASAAQFPNIRFHAAGQITPTANVSALTTTGQEALRATVSRVVQDAVQRK
ncbi:MAG TPA: hypothetical protein VF163_14280 [Micromonosporaceae bacterium]